MKKLKTMQILRRFAFDEWGGTETVVWNTSRKLIEKKNPTEIIATSALAEILQESVDSVPVKRFRYFYPYLNLKKKAVKVLDKKGGNPYSLQLYNYIKKSEELDLLHCRTMQRLANIVRLAAKKRNIPYVVSFHGGYFKVPQSEIDAMMKPLNHTFNYGKILDIIFKKNRFLEDATGIICVGHDEYLVTKERYPEKEVIYLPNGVDVDKFNIPVSQDFRAKYKIPQESELILCVSRIDYQKNQKLLVELTAKLRQKGIPAHLLLVGPVTSTAYFKKIEAAIKDLKMTKHVTIIKGLPATDPDLVQAYKNADYFILPSVHEPFGIVALEAWASKVPVIAHKVGGLQKLVTDNKTGLIFADSSLSELTEKYLTIRDNPQIRESLIEEAYEEVCTQYSWDIVTDKLIQFYQDVIAKFKKEQ